MLQAFKRPIQEKIEIIPTEDIIVIKKREEEDYNELGEKVTRIVKEKVNLTKKVNETGKLIKKATAEEKVAAIEKIFSK